jgi:GNAT superfamily N-acetyltransferase
VCSSICGKGTTIILVEADLLPEAARIHSVSWKESHRQFCSQDFIELHSAEHMEKYLAGEMARGKRLFMLRHGHFVGIESVKDSLIENLYVLPEEQRKGYGTELLLFAVEQCKGTPTLWILDHNEKAYRFHVNNGFALSGKRKETAAGTFEMEILRNA